MMMASSAYHFTTRAQMGSLILMGLVSLHATFSNHFFLCSTAVPPNDLSFINGTTDQHIKTWTKENLTHPGLLKRYPQCETPNWEVLSAELNAWVWRDMDWRGARCGSLKCFYPSVSNPTTGYLVGRQKVAKHVMKASHVAAHLGGKSLSIPGEVPHLVNVTADMRCFLANTTFIPNLSLHNQLIAFRLYEDQVVVHRMIRASEPNLVIGDTRPELDKFREDWPVFAEQNGLDTPEYCERFRKNMEWVKQDCETYLGLKYDFQVMLDTKGDVLHVDVDRVFEVTPNTTKFRLAEQDLIKTFAALDAIVCGHPNITALLEDVERDW